MDRKSDPEISQSKNPNSTVFCSKNDFSSTSSYNTCFITVMTLLAAIGGFLFGYDTGIIGGAILFFPNDFPSITPVEKEMIVSLAILGAAAGCLLGGPISDNYGRKITIIKADLLFILGAILMFFSNGITMLMCGRFIVGLGIGIASMIVPIYLAEVSPSPIRGKIVTINSLFITFGQFIAYLVALACKSNWRLMLGISGVPAFIQFVCMFKLPESPKWLIKKQKQKEATRIFGKIFNLNSPIGNEMLQREQKQLIETIEKENLNTSQYEKYKELFTIYRKILFIGVMLQIWQQFSGINTLMYYGPEILKKAGFGAHGQESETLYASLALSALLCFGSFLSFILVDRLGRRYLMLRTLPGCAFSMLILAIFIWMKSEKNDEDFSWAIAFSLFLYMGFFSIGMSSTPWTVNSEIYPLHLRGIGNSFATFGNWIGNFVISAVFLSATETTLGQLITYLVFVFSCIGAYIFIFLLLPETKGKTIEENVVGLIRNVELTEISCDNSDFENVKNSEI